MPRPRPIWLAEPTRYAALTAAQARVAIIMLVTALLVGALLSIWSDAAEPALRARLDQAAIAAGALTDALRNAGDFASVAHSVAPARPIAWAVPLPALPQVEAWLPAVLAVIALWLLAFGTMMAWGARLRSSMPRGGGSMVAMILLAAGLAPLIRIEWVTTPAVWAALLVTLALALHRPSRPTIAIAITTSAMLIDPAAAVAAVALGVLALIERRPREAAGWALGLAIVALVMFAHAHGLAGGPLAMGTDDASPALIAMLGAALFRSGVFALLPASLAGVLVVLALFGWSAWRDRAGVRLLWVIVSVMVVTSLVWPLALSGLAGWIGAPVLLGLVFVPDALVALGVAALDKRRITVTRIAR